MVFKISYFYISVAITVCLYFEWLNHLQFQDGRILSILAPMKYSSWLTTLIAPGWVINARPVPVSKLHARNHIWYFESFTKTWRLQPYVFVRMKARMWGTKEPSSASREGIPCTELKPTQSENIFWQKISFFTKKSFSSDGGNETVQRVLVNQSPSLLISRLVHYPRLHNIGRSPHDGSNQAEGKNSEV